MKRISLLTGAIVCTPIQLWRQPDGCGWGIGRRRKCGPRIGRAARFGAAATRGGWRRRRRETLHALQSQVLDAAHGSHALLGQVARDQRAARRHRPAASLEARRGLEDEAGHGARTISASINYSRGGGVGAPRHPFSAPPSFHPPPPQAGMAMGMGMRMMGGPMGMGPMGMQRSPAPFRPPMPMAPMPPPIPACRLACRLACSGPCGPRALWRRPSTCTRPGPP